MTEEQLRIEQAKLLGWTRRMVRVAGDLGWTDDYCERWFAPGNSAEEFICPPDVDHNSVALVRAALSEEERLGFIRILHAEVSRPGRTFLANDYACVDASSHDQLRAVLKVKGIEV